MTFDVVLMDINLPGLSGTTAAKAIRAMANPQIANLPIIGISAHVQAADRLENLAAGMSEVLAKPLSPEALKTALSDLVVPPADLTPLVRDLGAEPVAGLVRLFLSGQPKALAAIQVAATGADYDALTRAAHQIKGAAGNFDLPEMSALLARIESLAALGPSSELEDGLARLPAVFAQSRQALTLALARLTVPASQAAP
jgi:two-component system sensor histidine kinase TorS